MFALGLVLQVYCFICYLFEFSLFCWVLLWVSDLVL